MTRYLAICAALVSLAGCAPSVVEENILTGVVTYGGEPVWEGQLVLMGPRNRVSLTKLEPDGRFRVVDPPLGDVQIAVTNYPRTTGPATQIVAGIPGQATCVVPPRVSVVLPGRYAEPDTSGLVVQVRPGRQQIDLELPLQSDDPPPVAKPEHPIGAEVGYEAPEISGDDLDGERLSLQEQRGKVVAIVFWAHWCSLCREQFAHYHALVERMRDRPFVLLGVNCDPERSLIERENGPRGVNWRSWWDGVAVGGPVTVAWQLDGLPCVVLVDQNGIVQRRNLRGPDLDRAIEEMVRAVPPSPPDGP